MACAQTMGTVASAMSTLPSWSAPPALQAEALAGLTVGQRRRTLMDLPQRISQSKPQRPHVRSYGERRVGLAADTASYQAVAVALHNPKAMRAVGSACATNPLPIVIPCHRGVRSNGQLGNYLGGPDVKHKLLGLETLR